MESRAMQRNFKIIPQVQPVKQNFLDDLCLTACFSQSNSLLFMAWILNHFSNCALENWWYVVSTYYAVGPFKG